MQPHCSLFGGVPTNQRFWTLCGPCFSRGSRLLGLRSIYGVNNWVLSSSPGAISPKDLPYSLTKEELRWLCSGQETGMGEEKVGRLLCSSLLDLSAYLLKFTWFVWWRVWPRIEPKKLMGGRNGSGVHRFKISSFQNLQKTEKHPPGSSHQSFKSSM